MSEIGLLVGRIMGNFISATLYFLITYKCSKIIMFSYENQVGTPKRWGERVKELGRKTFYTSRP